MKIGACLPEYDKKDLLHAIGVIFGGLIRSEINGEVCRLRINLNVQKSLRRGIFVSINNMTKSWIPFKYESLPMFCFGCGRMGHSFKKCSVLTPTTEISKIGDDSPYTLALKAESNLLGKECVKFRAILRREGTQCSYIGEEESVLRRAVRIKKE